MTRSSLTGTQVSGVMYCARCTVRFSACSTRMVPTIRRRAMSKGTVQTTLVLRLTSPFHCPAVVCLRTM